MVLNQPLQYLIEMVIAVGVAFVISFLIYKDAEPKAATETAAVENIETADAVTTDATTADTTAEIAEETLTSPVNGTQIPLSEVADECICIRDAWNNRCGRACRWQDCSSM